MALTQKTRVSVYESRAYETTNQKNGQTYKGYSNKGFKPDGSGIKFSSPAPVRIYDLGGYDENQSEEFTLYGSEFNGDIRWSTQKKDAPQGQA